MRFLLKSTGFFRLGIKAGGLPVPRNCHESGPARPRHPAQAPRDLAGHRRRARRHDWAVQALPAHPGRHSAHRQLHRHVAGGRGGLRGAYTGAHPLGAGVGHRVLCHLAGHGVRAGAHRGRAGTQLRRGEEPDPGTQGGGLLDDGGFCGRRAQPAALAVHPGGAGQPV